MDRQVAIDMEKVIREVMEIDWRDKDGGWTDYIRIRVKIDVLRPLRRVVHLVGSEGTETVWAIKYEGYLLSVIYATLLDTLPRNALEKKNI
ncbi:hypothetical protein Gorai_002779 [Gossypium raimondii]|uniref:Uncharacterized protein n=1 Tax=Gossypium raimondii TaxID=29730 RepID=A0A7J8QLZ7_GOSRA|nr:hypothetical protein [Gossypium raimondii]